MFYVIILQNKHLDLKKLLLLSLFTLLSLSLKMNHVRICKAPPLVHQVRKVKQ